MEAQFTLFSGREKNKKLHELSDLCAQAQSIEEILLSWVTARRTLVVSRNPEAVEPSIGFSFMQGKDTVAMASIPLERFLPAYPNFEMLNETILHYDDQAGFSPDNEWFDKRNARLGISLHSTYDMNMAPPSAVGELVLSYALSTVGFAEICQTKRFGDQQMIKLSLVFFGPDIDDPESGWYENACVDAESLRAFVPGAYWM